MGTKAYPPPATVNTGVIHEAGHRPKFRVDLIDHAFDALWRRHIGLGGDRAPTCSFDLRNDAIRLIGRNRPNWYS